MNSVVLEKLNLIYCDDAEILNIIYGALKSFEEYHSVVFEMETKMKLYSYQNMDKEEYKNMIMELDVRRKTYHNSLLSSVNILNKLAEKEKLPFVYDGIVSQESPYRREVANSVLEYVENIVKNRI